MIHELEKANYQSARGLFSRLKTNTAIESIFNGNNEARLFVDDPQSPESILILSSWSYFYLAGDADNARFNSSMVEFLEEDFCPERIRTGSNAGFVLYPDSDAWCARTESLFEHLSLQKSGKTYFGFDDGDLITDWRDLVPEGFSVERVTPEIIQSVADNREFVDYINSSWLTADRFFEEGLGYCAVDETDFATICISVFATDDKREVGIKTFPDFRRRGLAYVTASAYIEECLNNDLVPVWSCFSENKVSTDLAEKLGYTVETSHPIYFGAIGE